MVTPIIIDTDPGIDDALAIALAVASPELKVLGLTTVGGNVGIEHTTRNALDVLALVGRPDIPVGMGAERPLVFADVHAAAYAHGDEGLGGVKLPRATQAPDRRSALELLVDLIEGSPEPVTLVAIGPLTNVALLAGAHPETYKKLARVVIMGGGAKDLGNTTPTAEFNIWYDPDAAARVFESGVEVVMVGLDVTQVAKTMPEDLQPWREGGQVGKVLAEMVGFYTSYYIKRYGTPATAQHDSLAMAYVIDPTLLETHKRWVGVECAGPLTRGQTVVDWLGLLGREPNAQVAMGVDTPRFVKLLVDRIAQLDSRLR